ncbi:MAG: AMP-dependent synthetase/ligase [Myxococcota bacterium]
MAQIDVSQYLELKIAPRAVFDRLPTHATRDRFKLPEPDGSWRGITWGAFAAQIRDVADGLIAMGLVPGERAAVYAGNRVEWLAAALGIQAAGGVMVPIYPSSTAEQVGYVIAHSDARVVFVAGQALLKNLAAAHDDQGRLGALERVVLLDDAVDRALAQRMATPLAGWAETLAAGREAGLAAPEAFMQRMTSVSLEQPGLMLYTSGTSGPPKGVPLTHRNIGINGRDWLECNAPLLEEGAVDLLWLPMSRIFGFGEERASATRSAGPAIPVDPMTVMQRLPEVRPDVFMSVPSLWEKLAMAAMAEAEPERQKARLMEVTGGRLHFCLSGGAGLKREVKGSSHAHGLLIIEGYGLTEASPTLTLNRPDAFRFDSVGRVLPSVELRLAEDGEILARGAVDLRRIPQEGDPDATAQALTPDGWLMTGDVGRFTDDGFLQIIDRKKDILVTAGGKNVPPVNIEQRFADDPFVAHAVVYGDGKRYLVAGLWPNTAAIDQVLAARGVPSEQRGAAMQALLAERVAAVNAQLASYESIKRFAVMDSPLTIESGFLTPTLKVKRKKVYEVFRGRFEDLYEGAER